MPEFITIQEAEKRAEENEVSLKKFEEAADKIGGGGWKNVLIGILGTACTALVIGAIASVAVYATKAEAEKISLRVENQEEVIQRLDKAQAVTEQQYKEIIRRLDKMSESNGSVK